MPGSLSHLIQRSTRSEESCFRIPFAFHFEAAPKNSINSSVFDAPESATLSVYVVDITVLRSFPSWTSPVRIRSPAPSFQQVRNTPLNHLLQFAPLIHAQAFSKALTASSRRSSEALV